MPDEVLLFRHSAFTFNGHRIYYDRCYVIEVEGYPGLILHGPLIATLLMDLLRPVGGLLGTLAFVMDRCAIRHPLGLPADGVHDGLPRW